jgi:hypothetical protein
MFVLSKLEIKKKIDAVPLWVSTIVSVALLADWSETILSLYFCGADFYPPIQKLNTT